MVGILSQHLATMRMNDNNRLVIHIVEVYTDRCNIVIKGNEMHQNKGCAWERSSGTINVKSINLEV